MERSGRASCGDWDAAGLAQRDGIETRWAKLHSKDTGERTAPTCAVVLPHVNMLLRRDPAASSRKSDEDRIGDAVGGDHSAPKEAVKVPIP